MFGGLTFDNRQGVRLTENLFCHEGGAQRKK
jgi:hypothetical protein